METREKLMAAAAELMAEVGYAGMTTASVAKRAGVSEGAIYRHFPSKEALAESVFADIWRIHNEYVEQHLPPRERAVERLKAFLPVTVEALDALIPQYSVLAQQEHLHFASRHCASHHGSCRELPPGPREYVALLEETIRLAQGAGAVRSEVDASVAAHFFFFGTGSCMEFYGDPHGQVPAEARLPSPVFEQLMNLMRHGIIGDQR